MDITKKVNALINNFGHLAVKDVPAQYSELAYDIMWSYSDEHKYVYGHRVRLADTITVKEITDMFKQLEAEAKQMAEWEAKERATVIEGVTFEGFEITKGFDLNDREYDILCDELWAERNPLEVMAWDEADLIELELI